MSYEQTTAYIINELKSESEYRTYSITIDKTGNVKFVYPFKKATSKQVLEAAMNSKEVNWYVGTVTEKFNIKDVNIEVATSSNVIGFNPKEYIFIKCPLNDKCLFKENNFDKYSSSVYTTLETKKFEYNSSILYRIGNPDRVQRLVKAFAYLKSKISDPFK